MRTQLKWLRRGIFCGAWIGASSMLTCVGLVQDAPLYAVIGAVVMGGAAVFQEVLFYHARKERDGDES